MDGRFAFYPLSKSIVSSNNGIVVQTKNMCRYGLNAVLDEALTQSMALGKIYPGLKLRVVGAKVSLPCFFYFVGLAIQFCAML